jgi:hypothetical protein
LKFGTLCPSKGQGTPRDAYTSFRKQEKQIGETAVEKKIKCKMMHKERMIRFCKTELDMSDARLGGSANEWSIPNCISAA